MYNKWLWCNQTLAARAPLAAIYFFFSIYGIKKTSSNRYD